jgi:hypothetical protein
VVKIEEKTSKMPIKLLSRHDFGWVGRVMANKHIFKDGPVKMNIFIQWNLNEILGNQIFFP